MPSGTVKRGRKVFPSGSSTLHISAISAVRAMASSRPGRARAMSSADVMKRPSVSCFSRFGSEKVLFDAMHMRTSCAFASSRRT